MILRTTFALLTVITFSTASHAGCEFATGPCSTDAYGNTYRTERNFGGGYNTYRNGRLHSQTEQTFSGSWRERTTRGEERTYNYNPYEQRRRDNPYGYR
jgi:hypothetical protein